MRHAAHIDEAFHNYIHQFCSEESFVIDVASRLRSLPGLTYKDNPRLHLTASGVVLSPDRMGVAAILHPEEGILIQPGGHIEENETPVEAAEREIKEETGLEAPMLWAWHVAHSCPIDIDVHQVLCSASQVQATHVDFRYVFHTRSRRNSSHEGVRWIAIEDVASGKELGNISRALVKAIRCGALQEPALPQDGRSPSFKER